MISSIILWAFMGYGMTTILVYGSIFDIPREWIKKNSKFFGTLIGCVMCTSTWVGFFLSICLGGLTTRILGVHWVPSIFFDGMVTCGLVWAMNGVVEFFEESRIK
jgi:MFS family permease